MDDQNSSPSNQLTSGTAPTPMCGVNGGENLTVGGHILPKVPSQSASKTLYRFLPTKICGVYRGANLTATNVSMFMSKPVSPTKSPDCNMIDQAVSCNALVQTEEFNSLVQSFDAGLPIPSLDLDVNFPVQSLGSKYSDHTAGLSAPAEGTTHIQTRETNVRTLGSYVKGNFTANDVTINVNPSCSQTSLHGTSPVPIVDTNSAIQTVGSYVGGNINAQNVAINVNACSSANYRNTKKSPFKFNIPTPTPHFKGRKDTLRAIRDYFDNLPGKVSDCWSRIVAITGMGGMGKTEMAYKFASESKDKFQSAAWINAETEKSALQSFLGLAKRLTIVSRDQKEADLELVKEVYHYIDQEDYGNVLVIFDNAVRLGQEGDEFGILECLPTDNLPNGRFPYILITTQTCDWDKRINTFQADGLSEEESIEFFSSCYKVNSSDCTDEFKMLHDLLEGYPLCMNLAASSMDFVPNKDSVPHLQQQIKLYVDKVKIEQNKLVSSKIQPAWGHKYNKTLSGVWQLTVERLHQDENGPEALEILQIMSFLHPPISSEDIVKALVLSTECPHPEEADINLQLKVLLRVLDKFHSARILKVNENNFNGYACSVGVHRLVQLVVREQTNCSKVLEALLYIQACDSEWKYDRVNTSALEKVLQTCGAKLSSRALPFVGLLACQGKSTARSAVETRSAETTAVATIWQLYNLEREITNLNDNAIEVLEGLVKLTKSAKLLRDRQVFAFITTALLSKPCPFRHWRDDGTEVPGYFNLESSEEIEKLVADLIANMCLFNDSRCQSRFCDHYRTTMDENLRGLVLTMTMPFLQVDGPMRRSKIEHLADVWLSFFRRLRSLNGYEWTKFWKVLCQQIGSPDASPDKIAELRTSLWDRGLANELVHAFEFFRLCSYERTLQFTICMDICLGSMDVQDGRILEVISALSRMSARIKLEIQNSTKPVPEEYTVYFASDVCLIWIKLLLLDGEPPSENLLGHLSSCGALNLLNRISEVSIREQIIQLYYLKWETIEKYKREYFPQFIQRHKTSTLKEIKMLVNFCNIFMQLERPTSIKMWI